MEGIVVIMLNKLAIPTKQQISWQDSEMGMFCHFGMNTFTINEWGEGNDSPEIFNPTNFDARQWASIAKKSGCKYLMLTTKHHDGFCLWQTETTDYSVKSSPWKNGKGDVVRECSDACKEYGIKFGIYLSPWDRHEPCYKDPEAYNDYYSRQLTELLTKYGDISEVWFDGAGSEGREYDWRRWLSIVHKYQPDAMVFNMGIPTIRWVGNEVGLAPYPCWNTATSARVSMFTNDMTTWLPETPDWVPVECDVPIRNQKWFWHAGEEDCIRSFDELVNIYYNSVGHGANLLINLAPDNTGRIPYCDEKRLLEMTDEISKRFKNPLCDQKGTGSDIEVDFGDYITFDHVVIMEDISKGERVKKYILKALTAEGWKTIVDDGISIGHKKIDRINTISASKLRFECIICEDEPIIRSIKVYNALSN